MEKRRFQSVVFLPGGVTPAAIQYEPLLNALSGADFQPLLKDLEVYEDETPPAGYRLQTEVEGVFRAVDSARISNFHLVGYSAGGAVALALTAAHPGRVISLALFEPAAIPSSAWFHGEREKWSELEALMLLPFEQRMPEFVRFHLRPGVPLPPTPAGSPPPWMARRAAGLQFLVRAFREHNFVLDELRNFTRPVYIAVGSLSDPYEERKAKILSSLFPDFRLEMYENRHHFDPPQRAEPERFAEALVGLWSRAENMMRPAAH